MWARETILARQQGQIKIGREIDAIGALIFQTCFFTSDLRVGVEMRPTRVRFFVPAVRMLVVRIFLFAIRARSPS